MIASCVDLTDLVAAEALWVGADVAAAAPEGLMLALARLLPDEFLYLSWLFSALFSKDNLQGL